MAKLPHFSARLQQACLEEASRRSQPNVPISEARGLLASIASEFAYQQGLRRDAPVLVNKGGHISAMLGFWSVMFVTFERFSEFADWLDSYAVIVHSPSETAGETVSQLDVCQ